MAEAMRETAQKTAAKAAERSAKWIRVWQNLNSIADDEVEIATSSKTEVLAIDKMRLYKYEPLQPTKVQTPLLVVYGLIGRYTMMDLQEDRSIVRNLLEQGVTVYMLDWGKPGRSDQFLRFEDYVEEYIARSVEYVLGEEGVSQLAMLGVCEGGVFATSYTALHPEKVKQLALAVTPIDFHADAEDPETLEHGFLNRWARNIDSDTIEMLVDSFGYLPGQVTGMIFQEMTPGNTLTKYNWNLPDALSGSRDQALNFLRMEKWLADRPHHPAEAAKQWMNELYKENRLAKGEFYLDGRKVDLKKLTMPILNIYATRDHIIPPPTSKALKTLCGTNDYEELELKVGHIGTFVSGKANNLFSDTVLNWLEKYDKQAKGEDPTNSPAASEAA